MIALTLQQDFLPTDVQVGDPPFSVEHMGVVMIVFAGVALAAVIIGIILEKHPKPLMRWLPKIFIILVMVSCIASLAVTMADVNDYFDVKQEARELAKDNLIKNIQSVYDVELVRGVDIYSTSPGENPELLVIQDDVAYEVVLKQNPDTFEPTLIVIASPDSKITELRKK